MKISNKNITTETHPLFPCGEWDGFFIYAEGPTAEQHPMPSELHFQDGQVSGGGGDAVGSFSWKGSYDKDLLLCKLTKYYSSHFVTYSGRVDENGIWGTWKINDYCSGGFHLWPKDYSEWEELEEEVEIEVKFKW